MALVIDETDPCAAATTLRAVYLNIVSGSAAQTVTFRAGASGVERSVVYHKADPSRLLTLIRAFEEKCATANGERPRRYALRAGGV
jgi:hypothetical protein